MSTKTQHDPVILTVGGLMVTIIAIALYLGREWAMVLIWTLYEVMKRW